MTKPLCWCCEKPIPKKTQHLHFGSTAQQAEREQFDFVEKPKNREEAQRFSNHPIVSLRYSGRINDPYVMTISVWGGDYISEFFCTDTCAAIFGKAAARSIKERKLVRP